MSLCIGTVRFMVFESGLTDFGVTDWNLPGGVIQLRTFTYKQSQSSCLSFFQHETTPVMIQYIRYLIYYMDQLYI